MKDKEKLCRKCKWRGTVMSRTIETKELKKPVSSNMSCDYCLKSGEGTCLKTYNGKTIDRRGYEFDKCLLFEEGEAEPDTNMTFGKGART